jgi:hypothetical protein
VARYERRADLYASCRRVDTVGTGHPDPGVEAVRRYHDDLCGADSRRELA